MKYRKTRRSENSGEIGSQRPAKKMRCDKGVEIHPDAIECCATASCLRDFYKRDLKPYYLIPDGPNYKVGKFPYILETKLIKPIAICGKCYDDNRRALKVLSLQ